MPENLEAERVAREAAAKEKIIDLIRETIKNVDNEELREHMQHFNPEDIANHILEMPGRDLAEKARTYIVELRHGRGDIINELPPEFQQEAENRMRALGVEIEEEMRKIEK
jgi:hypothetical protein